MLIRIISLSIIAALAVPLLAQTSTPANTVSEPHSVAIRQPHVTQIQNDVLVVAIKKLLQLRDLLRLHTPT
jgi:hypothetical protein